MFSSILELDKSITLALNGSDSIIMDSIMKIITSTIVWIPVGLFLLYYIYRKRGIKSMLLVLGGMALCILLADMMSSGVCKPLVARLRPSNEPSLAGMIDLVNNYHGGWYGFFSSHAANTMSIAVFLSLLLRHRPIVVLLIVWSLLNCWSRIYLGVHYMGDILVGLAWGTLVGWGVYLLLRRYTGHRLDLNTQPIVTAMLLTFAFIVCLAPLLTAK
ncbi:MAG: phosphatase PAP2 family protein [Bacteroidaceae bacterium]|nr:phosphatase PAP2 family protein [Bacteroidaceae bacterium]